MNAVGTEWVTPGLSRMNVRLQGDYFLDPQIYPKSLVNNIDGHVSRVIMRMLAGIRNRRSGLTYCYVTDTCCFKDDLHNPTSITFNV